MYDGEATNCSAFAVSFTSTYVCANIYEFIGHVKELILQNNMEKTFTKSDLKSGMVVRTRDNHLWLVVDDLLIADTGYMNLSSYTENLSHRIPQYDIMQAYRKAPCWGIGFKSGLSNTAIKENLIWERKEPKEYTMQEIADKLGIPVEELRIKK